MRWRWKVKIIEASNHLKKENTKKERLKENGISHTMVVKESTFYWNETDQKYVFEVRMKPHHKQECHKTLSPSPHRRSTQSYPTLPYPIPILSQSYPNPILPSPIISYLQRVSHGHFQVARSQRGDFGDFADLRGVGLVKSVVDPVRRDFPLLKTVSAAVA